MVVSPSSMLRVFVATSKHGFTSCGKTPVAQPFLAVRVNQVPQLQRRHGMLPPSERLFPRPLQPCRKCFYHSGFSR
jgi:hypothetical protein